MITVIHFFFTLRVVQTAIQLKTKYIEYIAGCTNCNTIFFKYIAGCTTRNIKVFLNTLRVVQPVI